jgi:putative ABC transport system permease protein
MNALGFAWRSLVRQPARTTLGILGVAAVGALLFDMLMLSDGLVVSMRDMLDRTGFDIRVTATGDVPRSNGARLRGATEAARAVAAVGSVRSAVAVRLIEARVERLDGAAPANTSAATQDAADGSQSDESANPAAADDAANPGAPIRAAVQGVIGSRLLPWTLLRGTEVAGDADIVINQPLADALSLTPGSTLWLRADCGAGSEVLPRVERRVAGIAEFPFQGVDEYNVAGTMAGVDAACGGNTPDEAEMILVTSAGEPEATAAEIRRALPHLRAVTNAEMLGRFQQSGITYFRQISSVLTSVTLTFALLLITVLLTVSVNQRLGEIAALRAVGFSRRRVVADVLCESGLIVGIGGLLSLPLGAALAQGLDWILKGIPNIPADMHFFVFQPQTLVLHVALLALTAAGAALYPMQIVATLPIAATLRKEITS